MLLSNETLERIINGDISVIFRVWKRPTVKSGGTLTTRKGLLSIVCVEQVSYDKITKSDLRRAGLRSRDELTEIGREDGGSLFKITLSYLGEDPRIALRENIDRQELEKVCRRLEKMGSWTKEVLQMIGDQPNIHAQILADQVGLEKLKFKAKVRQLKALGLTESLRPGYRLSHRGKEVLSMLLS